MPKVRFLFVASVIIMAVILSVFAACAQPAPAPAPAPAPTPAPAPAEVIELRFAYFIPDFHPLATEIHEPWARDVEAATGGKIKITSYPAASLVAMPDTDSAILSGLTDIGWCTCAVPPGRFPRTDVMSCNFAPWFNVPREVALSSRCSQRMYDEGYWDEDFEGMKVLFFYNSSPHHVFSVDPIRSLADMQGMQLGVTGTMQTRTYEALGFAAQPIGPQDFYMSLERKVIEAVSFDYVGAEGRKFHEVANYACSATCAAGPFYIAMNLDKWNSLPPDVQQAIDSVCGMAAATKYGNVAADLDDSAKAAWLSHHEITDLSADELKQYGEASKPVWAEWVKEMQGKGIDGQEQLDAAIRIANELK